MDGVKRHGTEWMKTLVNNSCFRVCSKSLLFLLLDLVSHIRVSRDVSTIDISNMIKDASIYILALPKKYKHIRKNSDDVRVHSQQDMVLSACSSCA